MKLNKERHAQYTLSGAFVGATIAISNILGTSAYAEDTSLCRVNIHDNCIDPDSVTSFGSLQYIIIDNVTGQTLLEQNSDQMRQPASTTKLMTAFVALRAMNDSKQTETCAFDTDTQVPMPGLISELRSDTYHLGNRGKGFVSARFNDNGEPERGIYPLQDLLLAMGTRSDGRAAEAIAVQSYICDIQNILFPETISSSPDSGIMDEVNHVVRDLFIQSMNDTARELGMDHTHFENPSGMPTEQLVSTPHDMAILTKRFAAEFPEEFETYFGQAQTNIQSLNRNITHTSGLVRHDPTHHTGKTGYTRLSGSSYAGTYVDGTHDMTIVLFGASSGSQRDSAIRRLIRKAKPLSVAAHQNHTVPIPTPRPRPRPDDLYMTHTASIGAKAP